jgi:AcrR family transcriptional regulator
MKITKGQIIQTASDIADRDGLSKVSLKVVATALEIRTPSLYNHIDSLDSLLLEVAHVGMREMNHQMTQSAIGISGDAAIQAIAAAYLTFMIAHPGIYETIQWAAWHQNDETKQILSDYHSLISKLVLSCGLTMKDTDFVVELLEGFLHGYTTQQLGNALSNPDAAKKKLASAMEVVLLGIHQKYQ